MRLLDLQPTWLEHEGARVAIMFRCPHCFPARQMWLTCFFVSSAEVPGAGLNSGGEREMFERALRQLGVDQPANQVVVGCNPKCKWTRSGDDFESMSITPSLDASAAGHWHGYVTNGQIA